MDRLKAEGKKVRIAVVGKYTGLQDSYISIIRALEHASFFVDRLLVVDWIEATDLENKAEGTISYLLTATTSRKRESQYSKA
mgnify:FL=1